MDPPSSRAGGAGSLGVGDDEGQVKKKKSSEKCTEARGGEGRQARRRGPPRKTPGS